MRTGFWRENLLERDHLGNLSVDVMAILKLVLMKRWEAWTAMICLRAGSGCECGNEPPDSTKCREINLRMIC